MDNNQPIISIRNLSKSFSGKPAVKNISLTVNKGEICGFLGPNGSGKTTTIRMICGLLTPDSGEGRCLGYDIIKESYQIKRLVGYMSQRFSLYEDLTIYENLDFIARLYDLKDRKAHIEKALEDLGLQDRRTQLAGSLSGGWKQRMSLATAILHQPELLLLDEPTAGVDPKARRDFWDQIHELASKGMTALVSTHYMDEAERCHRLAYILDGVLATTGTANEIIAQCDLTAWEVSGDNLAVLSEKLREHTDLWQISFFGNTLHVCYQTQQHLEKDIRKFQTKTWHWKKTTVSLEDVFVSLSIQTQYEQSHH